MWRYNCHQVSVVNASVLRSLSDFVVVLVLAHDAALVFVDLSHGVVEPLLNLQRPPIWQLPVYIVFLNKPHKLVECRPLAQPLCS